MGFRSGGGMDFLVIEAWRSHTGLDLPDSALYIGADLAIQVPSSKISHGSIANLLGQI